MGFFDGFPKIVLPTVDDRIVPGIDNPFKLAYDLATGKKTPGSLFRETAMNVGEQAMDALAPDWAKRKLGRAASSIAVARQRWLDYLHDCSFGLFTIVGAPGEGKTTLTADLIERFFEPGGRDVWTIGLPESSFPRSWKGVPISLLDDLGELIGLLRKTPDKLTAGDKRRLEQKLGDTWRSPDAIKLILSAYFPQPFVLAIDDAALYTPKGADNNAKRAIEAIINERRHLQAIIIANVQVAADLARQFIRSDAYLIKLPDMLAMGPELEEDGEAAKPADRDEFGQWIKWAVPHLLKIPDAEDRKLSVVVICMLPEVQFKGLWRHRRPAWYGEAQSRNAVIIDQPSSSADSDDDVMDAEFAEAGAA